MKKKILLVTGSYPPDVCGVGDYSERLFKALNNSAYLLELFYKTNWRLRNLFLYLKEIKLKKPDLIHFQYPTEGYGYSFLPLFLMIFLPQKRIIITLHELSNRTLKARIFTIILLFFSHKIIVTNEIEHNYIKKLPLLNRKRVAIINIGSNIPKSNNSLKLFSERQIDLAYFGHIRPIKGIETFISVANKLPEINNRAIIGQVLIKYESYLAELQDKTKSIDFILNGGVSVTADNLANCKVMYLPFPDGVSARRGSLMAAALNGCVIVTTYSSDKVTNDFFEKYCYLVNDEAEAEKIITQLLLEDKKLDKDVSKLMDLFSWEEIAKEHFEVYFDNVSQ